MFETVRHELAALCYCIARIGLAAGASAILVAGPAVGAEDDPSTRIHLGNRAKVNIRLSELYQSRSNLDGADAIGSETILRSAVRVPYAKWGEIDLSTRYDTRHYDFDGRSNLVDGEESQGTPFNSLDKYYVRLGTNIRFSKRLYWSTGAFTRAQWERGADLGNATRFGSYMGIGLQPDPRVFLGVGIGMQKKLHDGNVRFGPIWRIHWQMLERVDLLIENLTNRIRFDLNRDFQLQLIARYDDRKYQLRDRAEDDATTLKIRRVPLRLRLVWRRSDYYRMEFDFGAYLAQRLETNGANSNQSIDQGATVFVGMKIHFRN